jgi:hypothetical protein
VDFLRPRAIPALIAALACASAGADCASLQGTYRFTSAGTGEAKLSDLTMSRERSKLFRLDEKGAGPGSLAGSHIIQRRKVTPIAETGALMHSAKGTRLRYMDAAGKTLAEIGIDDGGRWACKGNRLERSKERTAGLGDEIRKEKVVETLERSAAGDLMLRETVTVATPPGSKPKVTEARFPAVR